MMIYIFFVCPLLSYILLKLFNRTPLTWFCDYGESVHEIQHRKIEIRQWLLPVTLFLTTISYVIFQQYALAKAIILITVTCVLCQIVFSDILYQIIPDQHILLLFALSIILFFPDFPHEIFSHILSGLIGGSLYLLVVIIGLLFKTKDAIGFGDIKLMTALGFLTSVSDILSIFVLTSFFSSIFLLFGLLYKKITWHAHLPLAPFISIVSVMQITLLND